MPSLHYQEDAYPMSHWKKKEVDATMKEIGSRIRQIRQTHQMGQDELAKLSRVDQATISQIEANGKRLTLPSLIRITIALKNDLPTLMKGL